MADAGDLKSLPGNPGCGFDSRLAHQFGSFGFNVNRLFWETIDVVGVPGRGIFRESLRASSPSSPSGVTGIGPGSTGKASARPPAKR